MSSGDAEEVGVSSSTIKAPWKLIRTAPGERMVLSIVDFLRGFTMG